MYFGCFELLKFLPGCAILPYGSPSVPRTIRFVTLAQLQFLWASWRMFLCIAFPKTAWRMTDPDTNSDVWLHYQRHPVLQWTPYPCFGVYCPPKIDHKPFTPEQRRREYSRPRRAKSKVSRLLRAYNKSSPDSSGIRSGQRMLARWKIRNISQTLVPSVLPTNLLHHTGKDRISHLIAPVPARSASSKNK